jgi:hypothetical protein
LIDKVKQNSFGREVISGLDNLVTSFKGSKSHQQKGLIGLAVALIAFIVLSMYVFPTAQIDMRVKSRNIPVNETISGREGGSTDLNSLTVPIRKVSKQESINETGTATGKKETGEKAKSSITVFNSKNEPVNIPAGTQIQLVGSNDLVYQISAQATIPAQENSKNVPIVAENFGEQYNKASSSRKDFSFVSGEFSDLDVFTYSQITGGSVQEVTAITQEDIDTAAQQGVNVLRQTLEAEVNDLISSNEIKLQEEISFTEPNVTPSQQAGEEADLFDVGIEMSAEIYVVNQEDLKAVAEEIVRNNSEFSGDFQIGQIATPEIQNITIAADGTTAEFDLVTDVSATAKIDSDQVKGEVLGLNTGDAENRLKELPDVESVELNYSPGYLPGFLRTLPSDENKVEVNLE